MSVQHPAHSPPPDRHLLLTRPQAQAEAFAKALKTANPGRWQVTIAPLMRIETTGPMPDMDNVDALIFSSANGVDAYASLTDRRDLTAVCVGPATTAAARGLGINAHQGGQDAASLAAGLPADGRRWLHVHGAHVTGNLVGRLRDRGISARGGVVYDQHEQPLGQAAADRLAADQITDIALFSPRSARLLGAALPMGSPAWCRMVSCLSPAVAQAAARAGFESISICPSPDSDAMIRLLNEQF